MGNSSNLNSENLDEHVVLDEIQTEIRELQEDEQYMNAVQPAPPGSPTVNNQEVSFSGINEVELNQALLAALQEEELETTDKNMDSNNPPPPAPPDNSSSGLLNP
jgi:hypothetical protein